MTKPFQKSKFTARQTALYRRGISEQIANGLEESARALGNPEDAAEALAVADCMRETARPENIYFSTGQVTSDGKKFDGYSSLVVAVGTRVCPSYQAKEATRWRRKIRKNFRAHGVTDEDGKLLVDADGSLSNFERGDRLRFLTVTMPDLKCSAYEKLSILAYAIVLFKKRQLWTDNVKGGYVNEEFTDGDQDYFYWHFHAHALVISKWLEFADIQAEWTDCVKTACIAFNVEFPEFDSKGDPLEFLNVGIRDVVSYAKENEMTLEKAVFEISKYMAKGSDILNVPTDELDALRRLLHNRNMIQSYGIFNNNKGKSARRDQPEAGEETHSSASQPLVHKSAQLTARKNRETLVRIGTRMILEGKRDEWQEILRIKMEKRRAFRRRQLAELNPDAIFHTLDSQKFSAADYVRLNPEYLKAFAAV